MGVMQKGLVNYYSFQVSLALLLSLDSAVPGVADLGRNSTSYKSTGRNPTNLAAKHGFVLKINYPVHFLGHCVLVLAFFLPQLYFNRFRSCEDDGDGNGYFVSTVYLFLESQRIAGCLVAEQIKKAYKILSSSKGGGHRSTGTEAARPNSTTVQFGEVIFHREVTRETASDTSYKVLEGNLSGSILCEEEAIPASCGIRAIWVSPCNRRNHIAYNCESLVKWINTLTVIQLLVGLSASL